MLSRTKFLVSRLPFLAVALVVIVSAAQASCGGRTSTDLQDGTSYGAYHGYGYGY
jgi:hypothetical protein